MRKELPIVLMLAFAILASQGFAYINVTSNSVTLPSRVNLSSNTTMLNLTFNLSPENKTVNIVNISFTFNSTNPSLTADQSNLTVCVYNNSIAVANQLGCNGTWVSNVTTVPVNANVSNITNSSLIVVYRIFSNTTHPMNVSLYINSNSSIGINDTGVSVSGSGTWPIVLGWTEVKYVQASANMTPIFVDTNVVNQTFRYIVYSSTNDTFDVLNITVPPGFTLVNVINYSVVNQADSIDNVASCVPGNCSAAGTRIDINYTGMKNITLFFNANTSASNTSIRAFNSTFNVTGVGAFNTNVSNNAANVTIQDIARVTSVSVLNNTVIVNGTNYWEFNLTLNVSANVNGIVQFNMSNWTSTSANSSITPASYATLRNNTDYSNFGTTNMLNVTCNRDTSSGVSLTALASQTYNLILRMVIPSGTPAAADWVANYSILFRSQP